MTNDLKRYLKIFIYSSLISISCSFIFSKYLNYEVEKELVEREKSVFRYKHLDSALFICTGLFKSNPTLITGKACEYIQTEIYKTTIDLNSNYPYTNFYSKYIQSN